MESPEEEKKLEVNWHSLTLHYPSVIVNPKQLSKNTQDFVKRNRLLFALGLLNVLLLFSLWHYYTQYHTCLRRYDLNEYPDPSPILNDPRLRATYGCLPEYRVMAPSHPPIFGCKEPGYKGNGYRG